MEDKEKEKVEKIICVLNTHIDELTISGDMITYKNYEKDVIDDIIMFYPTTKMFGRIYKPRTVFGIQVGSKIETEARVEKYAHLYARIDGYSFDADVEWSMLSELHEKMSKIKEDKFIEDLNKLCDGEQKV